MPDNEENTQRQVSTTQLGTEEAVEMLFRVNKPTTYTDIDKAAMDAARLVYSESKAIILQATMRHALVFALLTIGGWGCGASWCCGGEEGKPCEVKATLKNGTLRVFGAGAMWDFENNFYGAPWHERDRFDAFREQPKARPALSIMNVVVEEGVTHIGGMSFAELPMLKSVTIPASVSSIGYKAFGYCDSLMSITVAAENTRYSSEGGVLFNKNGESLILCPKRNPLDAYTVPSHVITIEKQAFSGCTNLKHVMIPSGVKTIGDGAFSGSAIRSVTIENGVAVVGEYAFGGCSDLMSVTIPGSVASTGYAMFSSCVNLTSVTMEEGLATIGELTFGDCANLTSITIPSSVTFIENRAFFGCANLDSVTSVNPVPPTVPGAAFGSLPTSACLYVPKSSIDAYRRADVWRGFQCIKPITETIVFSSPTLAQTAVGDGHFTDIRDGQKYKTVKIGEQTWMAENLNRHRTCYGEDKSNCEQYGSLYEWNDALTACPDGWHLPSRDEWRELANATGDKRVAGKKLKSKDGWNDDTTKSSNGEDAFGFSALPGGRGRRCNNQDFADIFANIERTIPCFFDLGSTGYWWSADGYNDDLAYGRYMNNYIVGVHEYYYKKENGFSVRCVKDRNDKLKSEMGVITSTLYQIKRSGQ